MDELQRVENLRTALGEEVADVSQLRSGDVVLVCWGAALFQTFVIVEPSQVLALVHEDLVRCRRRASSAPRPDWHSGGTWWLVSLQAHGKGCK